MICKNCEKNTIYNGKYCHKCGQKTNTKRLTLKHFMSHDIIHGMLHLDRGLPKTIKEILIRPGAVALDYIYGKRKKYYNFFYLLLLIIGLYLFLKTYEPSDFVSFKGNAGKDLGIIIKQNRKIVIFMFIPILAISSFLVFRRLRLTLLEFFIPAVIAVIGSSLFNILTTAFDILEIKLGIAEMDFWFFKIITLFFQLSILTFPIFVFGQFIKGKYSIGGKIWRLGLFYFLSFVILLVLLLVFFLLFRTGAGDRLTL